jgi:hypothetical protein
MDFNGSVLPVRGLRLERRHARGHVPPLPSRDGALPRVLGGGGASLNSINLRSRFRPGLSYSPTRGPFPICCRVAQPVRSRFVFGINLDVLSVIDVMKCHRRRSVRISQRVRLLETKEATVELTGLMVIVSVESDVRNAAICGRGGLFCAKRDDAAIFPAADAPATPIVGHAGQRRGGNRID